MKKDFFQSRAQINYPNEFKFTRIIEPKHATKQKHSQTTIIREYPSGNNREAYYPIPTSRNQKIYEKYTRKAKRLEHQGVYFLGRLANYKYINMDEAFGEALNLFNSIKKYEKKNCHSYTDIQPERDSSKNDRLANESNYCS
jgi:UDP-galactopyranose mutase